MLSAGASLYWRGDRSSPGAQCFLPRSARWYADTCHEHPLFCLGTEAPRQTGVDQFTICNDRQLTDDRWNKLPVSISAFGSGAGCCLRRYAVRRGIWPHAPSGSYHGRHGACCAAVEDKGAAAPHREIVPDHRPCGDRHLFPYIPSADTSALQHRRAIYLHRDDGQGRLWRQVGQAGLYHKSTPRGDHPSAAGAGSWRDIAGRCRRISS